MPIKPGQASQGPQPLPGVDAIIAVGSGKGGVGKTTLSVNLAVAMAKMGHKVGLLDADVYGPNVPLTGAVVVSTPSDVSLQDARKAIEMFKQMKVDLVGVVENMSYFVCRTAVTRLISFPAAARKTWRSSLAFLSSETSRLIPRCANPVTVVRPLCWRERIRRMRSQSSSSRGK